MSVVFDYQIFALQRYGGISRYIARLAEGLAAIGIDARILAPINANEYLKALNDPVKYDLSWLSGVAARQRVASALNEWLASSQLSRLRPTVLHETYYAARPPLARWGGCRMLTVHDMIHERFPEQFSGNLASDEKRKAVKRADHIIAVSQCTKDDLCEIFDVPADRVSVVHHGVDLMPVDVGWASELSTARPYLLFVGGRAGYKNFANMLMAIASRRSLLGDFDVIAFGGGAFSDTEIDLIRRLGFGATGVRHVSGGDGVLGALYRGATALVYPSIYEGFGLPPLEAMALDCPVVASNASSIPEVVGDATQSCDPSNIESIAGAIEAVAYGESLRHRLVERGRVRVSEFSWEACARRTADVYKRH